MLIKDFINIYNETFKYIENKYGKKKVDCLWQTISEEFCFKIRNLVEEKGLAGMLEYWGGEGGTLLEEEAVFEVSLESGVFKGVMHKCPSVGQVVRSSKELYPDYCSHCLALYGPVAEKNGFTMEWYVERNVRTGCLTGRCRWEARENKNWEDC